MAQQIGDFQELVKFASGLPKKTLVVVNPGSDETFGALRECTRLLNIQCILVGNESLLRSGVASQGGDLRDVTIVHTATVEDALRTSIALVREGNADILMKGSVDTSIMLREVLKEEGGLRTGKLMSDIVVLEYPARKTNMFVMITDGGMNLEPDLEDKMRIVLNAVEVAHALGNAIPKVAILSATEFVLPNLPSTLDAAALSKMNGRGQIKGCVIDGPLALDNALSPQAAAEKGIVSPVAGYADILVAPNIEAANSLAKSVTYFADLPLAHVIVGARVPILIPSRADKSRARLLSVALGLIVGEHMVRGSDV